MQLNPSARIALRDTFRYELDNILRYWLKYTIDNQNGGFYGEVDSDDLAVPDAVKGSVLNARILWSFSAAYKVSQNTEHLAVAKRAFDYINEQFIDDQYGGVYWSVAANGQPADTKKQIYAQAFTIYGMAEYYSVTKETAVLESAIRLYQNIERYSFDNENGGYLEAFTRDWKLIDDQRLSLKDANEKKTMNTHLHIIEAYTGLYQIWPDEGLAGKIRDLIGYFENYLIDGYGHLVLFLDENWKIKSDTVSYGHDIEASWLLLEAAEVLHDETLINRIKLLSVKVAAASAEGLNNDGSLNYEFEPSINHLVAERHWWVQAEAVVGYYNAFKVTGKPHFFNKATKVWNYTRGCIIDQHNGEWFWGLNPDGTLMKGYGKAGFWKCPYHNSRACMEMIKRLSNK
jgi:mannobiose 2-epimerase